MKSTNTKLCYIHLHVLHMYTYYRHAGINSNVLYTCTIARWLFFIWICVYRQVIIQSIEVCSCVNIQCSLYHRFPTTGQWLSLCCIPFLDLISVQWKLGWGLLHAHKATQGKTNVTSWNKNTNPVSQIICGGFIQGFACLSGWVGWWYLG